MSQNKGRKGDLGGGAQKSDTEAPRNIREGKKRAAAIAFEWERGYKKRAQGSGPPACPDGVGADATYVRDARL
jgi:hypothetical protein